jgi:hypothetical protein
VKSSSIPSTRGNARRLLPVATRTDRAHGPGSGRTHSAASSDCSNHTGKAWLPARVPPRGFPTRTHTKTANPGSRRCLSTASSIVGAIPGSSDPHQESPQPGQPDRGIGASNRSLGLLPVV